MAYCRLHNDVLGSSNLRDIRAYCEQHQITYLTTIDFLYYAYVRRVMTEDECADFIRDVRSAGCRLPDIDITRYWPHAML